MIKKISLFTCCTISLFLMLCNPVYGGASPAMKSPALTFIISVGINEYNSQEFSKLLYCESDAAAFINRAKTDSSLVIAGSYLLLGKEATKESIRNAFLEISTKAQAGDILIFYAAAYGKYGSIVLGNSEEITSEELFGWSQSIYAVNQLYYLDISYGDKFIGQLQRFFVNRPDESAISQLNRIVLSTPMAFEAASYGGGLFTMSYVKNKGIRLSDVFSSSHRSSTHFLQSLYFFSDSIGEKRMELEYFSEKELYKSLIVDEVTKSITINYQNDSLENDSKMHIRKGETLCFIMGCNNFDNFNKLNNAVSDSREIKDLLGANYFTQIVYLENPTCSDFKIKLKEIRSKYTFDEGSQFLLYISSHGEKNELDEGCLIFKDSDFYGNFLSNTFLLSSLKRFVGQLDCTNSLILLDICHSGTMFDEELCVKPNAIEIPQTNIIFNEKFSEKSIVYKNFLNQETKIFIGSSNDQIASDGTQSHSPFAAVIINFLSKNLFPINDSYYLQQEIRNGIMKAGAISIPLFCMYGGCKDDGRFLFIKK